jgi:hypothetical protein
LSGNALFAFPFWSGQLEGGWEDWALCWKGDRDDVQARWELRWEGESLKVILARVQQRVWEGRWEGRLALPLFELSVEVSARGQGEIDRIGSGVEAHWKEAQTHWKASWKGQLEQQSLSQRLAGSLEHQGLMAELSWKAQGWRLGWLGPASEFRLTLLYLL